MGWEEKIMKRRILPPEDQSARERVLKAAVELFTQRGYAATTVREIVEAAGVTKPILYYYFGNKEGIYLKILEDVMQAYYQMLKDVLQYEGAPTQKILDFGRIFYRNFGKHLAEARLFHSIYYGPPQGAPFFDFEVLHVLFEQTMKALVRQGVRSGEIAESQVDSLTILIMAVINFFNESQLLKTGKPLGEKRLETSLAWLFHSAAVPARKAVAADCPRGMKRKTEGRKTNAARRR
jgi:TetR/AcrR family transcriptional regulator